MTQSLSVLSSLPSDRESILAAARSVDVFNAEEIATVDELFEGYVRSPEKSGYNFLSCKDGGEVLGSDW